MACRRSQVRSLSGPPFETIRTRRKAGFLFVYFFAWLGQAHFGARGGVFLRGAAVLGARRWQARFAPLKAGKVCAPVISP